MKRITFDPLWKTLIDKKMSKGELRDAAQLSRTTITKMGKDESVGLDIVLRIASALNCGMQDIVDIIDELDTSGTERIARSEGRGT